MVYNAHMMLCRYSTSQAVYPKNNRGEKYAKMDAISVLTSQRSQFLRMDFRCHLQTGFDSFQVFFFSLADSKTRSWSVSFPLMKEGMEMRVVGLGSWKYFSQLLEICGSTCFSVFFQVSCRSNFTLVESVWPQHYFVSQRIKWLNPSVSPCTGESDTNRWMLAIMGTQESLFLSMVVKILTTQKILYQFILADLQLFCSIYAASRGLEKNKY